MIQIRCSYGYPNDLRGMSVLKALASIGLVGLWIVLGGVGMWGRGDDSVQRQPENTAGLWCWGREYRCACACMHVHACVVCPCVCLCAQVCACRCV